MMNALARYESLKRPLPFWSIKRLYFTFTRYLLKTFGNLSEGIRIGNVHGFDSGVMLDYVYKNRPQGKLGIGKLMDRLYLSTVGWRGIRERKALLQRALHVTLQQQLDKHDTISYLDIACGGGEYDIDVLKSFDSHRIEAELRDYKKENLKKAAQNAKNRALSTITLTEADAFDAGNYTKSRDVIVSSGFWEIIDDDALVKQCLTHVAKALNPGGSLVFTIQPDHPQLEFIARVLDSHTGKPWVMRLRSLELYKQWLDEVGLKYVAHQMEPNGIFGVVVALKK